MMKLGGGLRRPIRLIGFSANGTIGTVHYLRRSVTVVFLCVAAYLGVT